MHASVGDRILIRGKVVGSSDRHGEIIEVRGPDGGPPLVIRFDDGHQSVVFPGPDVMIEHREPA